MPKEESSVSVPRLVPACDVRRLPLTPTEGYLLSRIDGHVSAIELCLMTGLGRDDVDKALEHLTELGAVTMGSEAEPAERRPERSEIATQAMHDLKGPIIETYRPSPPEEAQPASARALYDPAELDEDVEVPEDKRRMVLDLFYRLEDLNYYELLGIERAAEKKQIKDAYFRLASEYHPDRYFRKNLGSYKTKIEAIFGRITLAHDTLTRKQTRADYDSYIETVSASRTLEAAIRGPESREPAQAPKQEPPASASPHVTAARQTPPVPPPQAGPPPAAAATRLGSVVPGRVLEAASGPQPVVREVSQPAGAKPSTVPPASPPRGSENDRLRRELLARRLAAGVRGGSVAPGPARPGSGNPGSSTVPSRAAATNPLVARPSSVPGGAGQAQRPLTSSVPPSMSPESAAADLRRRYEERQAAIRRAQLKDLSRQAEEATAKDDAASAARAYRSMLELCPDDECVKLALAEAEKKATQVLAEMYLKQARYEEKEERWKEAARSYARVAEALPDDAPVQERAAFALLKSDGDMHMAAQYARRAVELNDKKPEYRTTMARVYLAAGLKLNARRELEIAAELAPGDANISRLLKSLR